MKEEIIINTQLALFFKQPIMKPEESWQPLNDEMGNIFDATPIIFPVPDKPELYDVPIVQMNSSNKVYSCNMARNRVDFFIAGVSDQKYSDIKDDLSEKSKKYFSFFSNEHGIKKIGFVGKFFVKDEDHKKTIATLLNDKFTNLHKGTIEEAYIRYVSKINIEGYEVNNFTSIEKYLANISDVGNNIKGVLITRDFNTIPKPEDEFDEDKIESFIEKAEEKFELEKIKEILWTEKMSRK